MDRKVRPAWGWVAGACFAGGLLGGCAAPVRDAEPTEFLSDTSRLAATDEDRLAYFSDRLPAYRSFLIDPVALIVMEGDDPFTAEQLDNFKAYTAETLRAALTDEGSPFAIVDEPGPGVARIRVAVSQLDRSDGVLNVAIFTKITGAGLGGVGVETEIIDSVTGEQLAAIVRAGSGSRIVPGGITPTGHARRLVARWFRELRAELDRRQG